MKTTGMTGEGGDGSHEHASQWPLIPPLGAAGLYAGVGAGFVGPDLLLAVVPAMFGGGAVVLVVSSKQDVFPGSEQVALTNVTETASTGSTVRSRAASATPGCTAPSTCATSRRTASGSTSRPRTESSRGRRLFPVAVVAAPGGDEEGHLHY